MNALAKRPRTRRSYAIEVGCWAAIWIVNLHQILTRFRTMSFLMATSAVMAFLIIPAYLWHALESLRKETT